jgi:hypothetical protein
VAKWTHIASGVAAYGAVIGFLYLWGYWGRLGVNFLEFADLSDLVRLSLLPVVASSVFFLIGLVLGELITTPLPEGGGRRLAEERGGIHRAIQIAFGVAWVVAVVASFAVVMWRGPAGWYFVGGSVAGLPYLWLKKQGVLANLHDPMRSVMLYAVCALPFFVFGNGGVRADAMKSGSRVSLQLADVVVGAGGRLPLTANWRYLGTLGEFGFFFTDNETVFVTKWDEVKWLELRGREKVTE